MIRLQTGTTAVGNKGPTAVLTLCQPDISDVYCDNYVKHIFSLPLYLDLSIIVYSMFCNYYHKVSFIYYNGNYESEAKIDMSFCKFESWTIELAI